MKEQNMTVKIPSRVPIALFGVAVLALSTLALAHTKLEKSVPAAGASLTESPKQIELWFNEKIDPAVSKLELSSPSGKIELTGQHQMGEKTLMAAVTGTLGAGSYTVNWQAAGTDGHVVKGDFTFSVKTTH
jgi:hypothetical protein